MLAYEIAEQSGFRIPDVVVYPLAVGEAFLSGWHAFREMHAMRWIDRLPLMVAAQSPKANPIVRAFRESDDLVPVKRSYTVAQGPGGRQPGREEGAWALRVLHESKGLAADVDDELILDTQHLLGRTEGIDAGPTGVGALAAVRRLLTGGFSARSDHLLRDQQDRPQDRGARDLPDR